ncbi:hypothetical protein G7046_g6063 [Stylonectria norvegica]|nr:hypothetical protein G7046_g6063 [Stylonectria norvegica]
MSDEELLMGQDDEKPPHPVVYDQPLHQPRPVAVPGPLPLQRSLGQSFEEKAPRRSVTNSSGRSRFFVRKRFWSSPSSPSYSPSSRRPLISAPSDFRHVSSASPHIPPHPRSQTSKLRPARQLRPGSFRPLELSFYMPDNHMSPILPHFEFPTITPPAPTYTPSYLEEDRPLVHQNSHASSMSFHVPRKQTLESSPSTTQEELSPVIPLKSRSRARAYTSPDVDRMKERVATAMIEVERLQAQIDDVIDRQSLYASSRPSTPHSVARTMPELEPMPSIPALPPAAPSFAQRLNSDSIKRPSTAPINARLHHPNRTRAVDEAPAMPSTPPPRLRRDDRPPPPPLPLVLRPPLRKKKSFSHVSTWLFPGSEHSRDLSLDSVTNLPRPVKGSEGFYQCVSPGETSRRRPSYESVDTVSTWETDDEDRTVPTTWSPESTPATKQEDPFISRTTTNSKDLDHDENGGILPLMMKVSGLMDSFKGMLSGGNHKYSAIPEPVSRRQPWPQAGHLASRQQKLLNMAMGILVFLIILYMTFARTSVPGCEVNGNCTGTSTHIWGQYSPFFSVPSVINASTPEECEITFVQVLARHGSRYPTISKTKTYKSIIDRIQSSVKEYGTGYEFIQDYKYSLKWESLTSFGQKEMVDMGIDFYQRYGGLAEQSDPFVRAAGSLRVIESAKNFTQGLYESQGKTGTDQYDKILVIPESPEINKTLNHGNCPAFDSGPASEVGHKNQYKWKAVFVPAILERLNRKLPGANLIIPDVIDLMDLCPYHTVNTPDLTLSDFCRLYTEEEWREYDYYESLDKWYGFGPGNPLGPTQGVAFVNELIARLTGQPVDDHTSTNRTLDSSPETFPLNRTMYADFSHDNTMVTVYAALGLYNKTEQLPTKYKISPEKAGGFSSAWTVPFAGRMYVEKMQCKGKGAGKADSEELSVSSAFCENPPRAFFNRRRAQEPRHRPLPANVSLARSRARLLPSHQLPTRAAIMVSTAGGIVIAIVVLVLFAAAAWVVFTQLRARKLGVRLLFFLSLAFRCRDGPMPFLSRTSTLGYGTDFPAALLVFPMG